MRNPALCTLATVCGKGEDSSSGIYSPISETSIVKWRRRYNRIVELAKLALLRNVQST